MLTLQGRSLRIPSASECLHLAMVGFARGHRVSKRARFVEMLLARERFFQPALSRSAAARAPARSEVNLPARTLPRRGGASFIVRSGERSYSAFRRASAPRPTYALGERTADRPGTAAIFGFGRFFATGE